MGLLSFVRVLFCGTIAAACAVGCTALTGADALVVDDREPALSSGANPRSPNSADDDVLAGSSSSGSIGGTSSSSSSSSSSSGTLPDDAGADAPAPPPGPPPGAIIHAPFTSTDSCTSSIVTNGASKVYEPNGRSGGACRVCAVASGEMFLELSGTATKQGQATFEAYTRRVSGATTPTSATIQFRVEGVNIVSSSNVGDDWTRLGGGSISVQSGATALLRVGLPNAAIGDCLVFDDAQVVVP